ncbi:hypothetical protein SGLAM104S_01979 [Streptomyces glaucescens]
MHIAGHQVPPAVGQVPAGDAVGDWRGRQRAAIAASAWTPGGRDVVAVDDGYAAGRRTPVSPSSHPPSTDRTTCPRLPLKRARGRGTRGSTMLLSECLGRITPAQAHRAVEDGSALLADVREEDELGRSVPVPPLCRCHDSLRRSSARP